MAIFTVHIPATRAGEAPSAEKIVLLRDGFSIAGHAAGSFLACVDTAPIPRRVMDHAAGADARLRRRETRAFAGGDVAGESPLSPACSASKARVWSPGAWRGGIITKAPSSWRVRRRGGRNIFPQLARGQRGRSAASSPPPPPVGASEEPRVDHSDHRLWLGQSPFRRESLRAGRCANPGYDRGEFA